MDFWGTHRGQEALHAQADLLKRQFRGCRLYSSGALQPLETSGLQFDLLWKEISWDSWAGCLGQSKGLSAVELGALGKPWGSHILMAFCCLLHKRMQNHWKLWLNLFELSVIFSPKLLAVEPEIWTWKFWSGLAALARLLEDAEIYLYIYNIWIYMIICNVLLQI